MNTAHQLLTIENKQFFLFEELKSYGLLLLMSGFDSFGADISEEEKQHSLQNIYRYLGIDRSQVYAGHQVHSSNIRIVDSDTLEENSRLFHHEFPQTDGLITSRKKICLITKFADCTPIVIFDKKQKVLVSLHSGWRGTQQKIASKSISLLKQNYYSDPNDLIVFIGPAIQCKDFEVGTDLVEEFNKSHGDISPYLHPKEGGKFLFNMTELIQNDLLSEGISQENIFVSTLSTYDNPLLHSYRRDKRNSGRMFLFSMMLK